MTADEARTSKCLGICACELHFRERFFPQPLPGTLGNWIGEFLFVFYSSFCSVLVSQVPYTALDLWVELYSLF